MKLSERDKAVLDFIKQYMLENGFTPTIREICEGVGLYGTSTVHKHFQKLVDMGYITQKEKRYCVKGMRYVEDK
jgi:repressor LexA